MYHGQHLLREVGHGADTSALIRVPGRRDPGVLLEIGETVGVPVEEEELFPKDLYEADELFISSTNRSALGVAEVEGRRLPEAPGPVTQKLERAFAEYVARYVAEHREASRPVHRAP